MTIRAALEVLWSSDESDEPGGGIATAQTILDAADITLPTGDLANGAYDAFGAAYGMPEWVVADPENMDLEEERIEINADKDTEEGEGIDEEEAERRREEKGKAVIAASDLITVKARLSVRGGADIAVQIGKRDTVRLLMKRIIEEAEVSPSSLIPQPSCKALPARTAQLTDYMKLTSKTAPPSKTDQNRLPRLSS
jgi:Ubiquitin-binding domain